MYDAIHGGIDKLLKYVHSGAVPELRDVIPYYDESDNENHFHMSEEEDDHGDEDTHKEFRDIDDRLDDSMVSDVSVKWIITSFSKRTKKVQLAYGLRSKKVVRGTWR